MPRKKWKLKAGVCSGFWSKLWINYIAPSLPGVVTNRDEASITTDISSHKDKASMMEHLHREKSGDDDVSKLKTENVQYLHPKIHHEQKYACCSCINIYKKHQFCTHNDPSSIIIKFQSLDFKKGIHINTADTLICISQTLEFNQNPSKSLCG